ncbi:MAG: M20/M25/M40 family metallo-hydrolase [Balneolaceae bacterium]|nr:M20/M25/M40 family metallo-hydrolase [Balneolaceae bacterium]
MEDSTPEARLSGTELEKDLRFLASDELRGRRAGMPSAEVAARYIAEQFRSAGVTGVPGAEDGYFQTVPLNNGKTSRNVIGMIEGTDPELKDEYILLTAHYDHVGVRSPRGDNGSDTPADSIYNGARDNGMGTIAVIAAARAFAKKAPKRSILLLAVTAEEMGLVGSRYYAENPLIPHNQVVYNLNVDTGGYSDTSIVTVVGLGRTSADSLIIQGTKPFGIEPIADPSPGEGLFDRSDNVNFARQGIPAPTFSPGFRAFSDPGVANYYHQPADEADDMDYDYLTRFTQAYVHTARIIANADEAPHWMPGDKYEEAAKQLYGGGSE